MTRDRDEYVDVEVDCIATGKKAVLLVPHGCDESDAKWVAKSLLQYDILFGAGESYTIGMQRWVAEREGFLDTDVDDGEDDDVIDY